MSLEQTIKELAAQGTLEALERHLPDLLVRMQAPVDPDRLRSYDETAEYMGTTRGAVKALVDRKELWTVQVGNEKKVPHQAVHEYIKRERIKQQFRSDQDVLTDDIPDDIAELLQPPSPAKKAVRSGRNKAA